MTKRTFISFEESINQLRLLANNQQINNLSSEKIALSNSLGRITSENLIAKENSPIFPTASLDGYAIRFIDQKLNILNIFINDNPAGNQTRQVLPESFAIKTFTGSIMPIGSDTLIPIENVTVIDGKLKIDKQVSIGNGVRPIGELYKNGDVIIKKGTKISFTEIGVFASLNISFPKVTQKPRVAIFSTGSEILDLGEERETFSQIRSSNNHALEALIRESGAEPIQYGIIADEVDKLKIAINETINSGADFIVSTGGVSVGDYDLIAETLQKLNFETIFHGVKIKPGQHILVAKRNNQIFIALPGFALSAIITAIIYILPLIRNKLGLNFEPKIIQAILREKYYKKSRGKTEFTPCNLIFNGGKIELDFNGKRVGTSALLTNMLDSPHLLFSSENDGDREKNELMHIYILD